MLQFSDNFDRAWRRVGLSLDRSGFTVEDRNRADGVYFVRYVEPTQPTAKPGFFSRLFGASEEKAKAEEDAKAQRYQVRLTTVSNTVQVTLDKDINTSAPTDVAQSVLEKLQESMRNAFRGTGERKPGQFGLGEQF